MIEIMTVISVIAIVLGLLYAYTSKGWDSFLQSSSRGLSQLKAKLAIRILTDDIREANKKRLTIGRGTTYGVPLPDDRSDNSPFLYFTKPVAHTQSGEIVAYNYILYYFAKPTKAFDSTEFNQIRFNQEENNKSFFILKAVKFLNQSKTYTEDEDKEWPFQPPILEINKSVLPEDILLLESLSISTNPVSTETNENSPEAQTTPEEEKSKNILEDINSTNIENENLLLDHFGKLKKYKRSIPVSGNFLASSLTDPFSKEEINIFFGQEYNVNEPIKIKVLINEPVHIFGLGNSTTDFEVSITPRN